MKYVVRLIVFMAIVGTATSQFTPNRLWIGPTLGYSVEATGGFGGALQGEYAITDNIGAGVELSYFGFREEKITDMPGQIPDIVSATVLSSLSGLLFGTYHFMPEKEIDPFVRVGLGYRNVGLSMETNGVSQTVPDGFEGGVTSGFAFAVHAGARYHFSEGLSARAVVGYPMVIGLGFDLATGGKSSKPVSVEDDSSRKKSRANEYSLWIGPYIMGKASIKSEVAEGWKTGIVFNIPPDFGASILVPFGKHTNVGFGLDLGLANYGYQFRPENDARDSVTVIARYSYFNMFPHFNLGGFIVGMNFGFVNGASARTVLDSAASIVGTFRVDSIFNGGSFVRDTVAFTNGTPKSTGPMEYMASLIEVRIGGAIPVVTSDFGRLDVLLQAGYSLSGIFEDYRNYEGSYPITAKDQNRPRQRDTQPQESLNPHVISLSVGLCYRFRLGF